MRRLSRQWETDDPLVQGVSVGTGSALTVLGFLWLEGVWSFALIGHGIVHVALTIVCAMLVGFFHCRRTTG